MSIQNRFTAKNGLNGNNLTIINVSDPINDQDVTTKHFSSNASNLSSGTVPLNQMPDMSATYVDRSGSTMTGILTLSANPINPLEAATKGYVDSQVSSNLGGMIGHNRIINGSCNVFQRNTVSANVASNVSIYTGPDRFFASNIGTSGTFTQTQGTITYNSVPLHSIMQTITVVPTNLTGTNYLLGIAQTIEGYNCADCLGQTITISFIFQTSVIGTYSLALRDHAQTNTYVTTFDILLADTPTEIMKTIVVPVNINIPNNTTDGLQVVIGSINLGSYQTSVLDVWQAGNYTCASTSTNWTTTINNYIQLTQLQFEIGNTATPFERLLFGAELLNCQRYYAQTSYNASYFGAVGQVITASHTWPQPLRFSNPTITTAWTPSVGTSSASIFAMSNRDVEVILQGSTSTWSGHIAWGSADAEFY